MRGAAWNPQYHQVVLASDPIAYWLQDEKQGAVSYDWVRRRQGSSQDGAYTGVTLGEPGIGDGRTAPFFDGANDFNNIYTVPFRDRFSGSEGSVMAWAKVANAGVWTDGTFRWIFRLRADNNNRIEVYRSNANNILIYLYISGGVANTRNVASSALDFFGIAITWSKSADEVRAYYNGIQQGATLNGLGVWAGNLNAASTLVGASAAPGGVWHGYIAHAAVWDRPLPPDEVLHLYNEGFV